MWGATCDEPLHRTSLQKAADIQYFISSQTTFTALRHAEEPLRIESHLSHLTDEHQTTSDKKSHKLAIVDTTQN